jgi:polysaccharide export outer membrane protein
MRRRFVFQAARAACRAMLALTLLSGCAMLPRSGPMADDIEDRFTGADNPLGVRIVTLTPSVATTIETVPPRSLAELGRLHDTSNVDRIGPGDVLAVSIYETTPGLFTNLQRLVLTPEASTSAENLPRMEVDRNGMITIPFAGLLRVAGHTPTEVQQMIVDVLTGKASQPQVIVNVVTNQTNIAYVSGDVRSPGRFPLSLSRERLLDVLALAGGPTKAPGDSVVRVTRHDATVSAPLVQVQNGSPDDILLDPQDRIQVSYVPRSFTVFGATGRVAQVSFDTPTVSLADGIARAGGLDDNRADPDSLFLFRFEDPTVGRALGLPPTDKPVPVIYRANMEDPLTMFVAQRVALRDHDLLYVANARSVPISKFMGLVNQAFTPAIYTRTVTQ